MAQAARSQGCTVSLTTNGMNLTEAMQLQVLEHLDMVAVSLDGAKAELMSGCGLEPIFSKSPNRLPLFAPASGLWEGNARRWSYCS